MVFFWIFFFVLLIVRNNHRCNWGNRDSDIFPKTPGGVGWNGVGWGGVEWRGVRWGGVGWGWVGGETEILVFVFSIFEMDHGICKYRK